MHGRWAYLFCAAVTLTGLSCQPEATPAPNSSPVLNAIPARPAAGLTVTGPATGDLGAADYGQKRTCTFTLANGSAAPLDLEVSDKSCACAGVELRPATVPAGGSCQVVLTWVPKLEQTAEKETRLTATIRDRKGQAEPVKLEAVGRIKPALHVNLPRYRLDFGKIDLADLGAGKEQVLEVYTLDTANRDFTLQALPAHPGLRAGEPQPLSADRLQRLQAAAGYRITLTAGPGLPAGKFRELLRLKTNLYPDHDLEVPVEGQVDSGAFGLSADSIPLPEKIPLAKGYKCPPLEITLRGEPGRKLTLAEVAPKFLQVEVVQKKENVWQVKVQVPAGEAALRQALSPAEAEEMISFGFDGGGLTFRTDHPLVPTLRIPVGGSQLQR